MKCSFPFPGGAIVSLTFTGTTTEGLTSPDGTAAITFDPSGIGCLAVVEGSIATYLWFDWRVVR